jgi:hypothetical protein
MFKGIDRSPRLARFIAFISEYVAKRRGLPAVIGIALVLVSFLVQLLNFYIESTALDFVATVMLYIGVLTALIGLLVSEALGK